MEAADARVTDHVRKPSDLMKCSCSLLNTVIEEKSYSLGILLRTRFYDHHRWHGSADGGM